MGYIESYSRKAKTKQYVPTYPDGSKGVRATMNNMGLDNSKIGWKDGSVTYGKISFKPSAVKDGVSYAPTSDIQGFVNDIYRSEGKNPVRVTDYVSPSGLGSVSYSNNGMVSVGGENIPILYMDGDRAVVDSNLLDSAYNKLSKKTGIDSAADMYGGWRSRYGGRLDTAYGNMTSDKKWSYNPETDPAYQAYSRMYQREGERAYRDAAAKMASRKNNGGMTSAAQTLANSQLAYYMSKLTDMIPELEKNSYERYMDEYQKSKDAYNALADMANADWNKAESAQKLAREDYRNSVQNEENRTDNEIKRRENLYKLSENERNANADIQNAAWDNAEKRGFFTEEEAKLWNIPKKEDGTYMTPNDIKILNDVQYFNEASKPQLDYKSEIDLNELREKYDQIRRNDAAKAAQSKSLASYKYDRQYSNSKNLAAYRYNRQLANSKAMADYKESIKYKRGN